jgi:hypothetical protein
VAKRLFTFAQLEFPWELGPADGRYLMRKPGGLEAGQPQHVIVLATVGAERRGALGSRAKLKRTDAEPARVAVSRATIVDPVPVSAESQAKAWLERLDAEREALAGAAVLNRLLFAHRVASAAPHVNEVSASQALVVRAGYGEGEQVADGQWTDARELRLSRGRAGRRATVLRPQERLARMLAGREQALLCEELTLRARLDADAGRLDLAAVELDRAYTAALRELSAERREDLGARIDELEGLSSLVRARARAVLPEEPTPGESAAGEPADDDRRADPSRPDPGEPAAKRRDPSQPDLGETGPDEPTIHHALERLEAALRARTARGFSVS